MYKDVGDEEPEEHMSQAGRQTQRCAAVPTPASNIRFDGRGYFPVRDPDGVG